MKKKLNFKPIWLVAPAIVIVWMLVMYFIKEVFPFGEGSMISYDLRHGGVPGMLYAYDAWHSGDFFRLFYDFTTAGGFGRGSLLTLFQPRFLFTIFWPREYFVQSISIFFVVEFALIAFASSYSFSKIFSKLPSPWLVLMSLMYTFCGFNMLYYTNIDWLDTVLLYPLLIVFALNMMAGKSKVPFFLVLTYLLTFNTYMAFFVVLSLVVFGGLYIFIIEDKSNRKRDVLNLGVGTGAALAGSAYSIFMFVKSVFSTARFDEGSFVIDSVSGNKENLSGIRGVLASTNELDIVSIFMFLGMAVAIVSLITMWVHFKKHRQSRKYTVFFTISIVLFVIQILFKSVMLLWHVGSYQMFPFRNGYMVAFFCCCIIGYYYSNFESFEGVKFKNSNMELLSLLPCLIAGFIAVCYVQVYSFSVTNTFNIMNTLTNLQTNSIKYPYLCFAGALCAFFLLVKLITSKALRRILTITVVVLVIGLNSLCFIARNMVMQGEALYQYEMDFRDNVKKGKVLDRVNNDDSTLGLNYGYVADVPVLANWTHGLSGTHLNSFKNLGFNTYFTFMTGVGGTLFSEALMRVVQTTARNELNEELYEKTNETDKGLKFYDTKYTLPVGVVFDEKVLNLNADDFSNTYEYQEAIYNSLTGDSGLFEKMDCENISKKVKKETVYLNKDKEDGSGKELWKEIQPIYTVTYTLNIDKKTVLYIGNKDKNTSLEFSELKVNGELFHVYTENNVNENGKFNTAYPDIYNSGALELGVFEDETVKISIKYLSGVDGTDTVGFYAMDLNKMDALCNVFSDNGYSVEGNKISFEAEGKENGVVFVPLSYDTSWGCMLNGKAVAPVCVLGNFIGVEVSSGTNEIVMEYSNNAILLSYLWMLLSFLAGAVVVIIDRKIKIPKQIYTLAFVVFSVIFVGAMVVLYAMPVGFSVVNEIISLIK